MSSEQNIVKNDHINEKDSSHLSAADAIDQPPEISLPVGLFLVDSIKNFVLVNTYLAEILRISASDKKDLSYQVFSQRLFSCTDNPEISRIDFELNIANLPKNPSMSISLTDFPDNIFKLFLFPDPSEPETDNFGGMMLDLSADQNIFKQQMKILVDLFQQTRKISAAATGNIQALTGNILSWNEDLVKDFLLDIQDQISLLNGNLDLALNFINILYDKALFPETVNYWEFLRDIFQDYHDLDLYFQDTAQPETPLLPVHLDPEITKLALEYLLDEISGYIQSANSVDAIVSIENEEVKLNLQSSRTLTLPGFSTDAVDDAQVSVKPTLLLAERIISSQGGSIHIKNHAADQIPGMSIDIRLPLYKNQKPGEKIKISYQAQEDPDTGGRILLAESQSEYQVMIQDALSMDGYRVDLALDGTTALDMVQRINPSAVIAERNLPGMDGILLTQGIRRWSAVPIIILSSRTRSDDLVQAFKAGADDYMKKPFSIEELILRTRSLIRRSKGPSQTVIPDIYYSGDIRIDYSTGQVWKKGNPVRLTPIEYNLLVYMARQGKQIMPYEQLLDRVWDGPEKGSRQGLFVHVRRLREKIENDPDIPQIILNKWGVGYEFNP